MASIRKRGDKYYLDYRINGKRVRKSVGTSKDQAEQALADLENKIKAGTAPSIRENMTFDELCSLFCEQSEQLHSSNTQQRYSAILTNFSQFLAAQTDHIKYIHSINDSLINQYKTYRLNHKVKNKTINSELMVLRMIFRLAVKSGVMTVNPAEDISKLTEEKKAPPQYLSMEECDQLLKSTDAASYPIIFTLLNTGLRKFELENLIFEDIDLDKRQIFIVNRDNRNVLEDNRVVPINDDLYPILLELVNQRKTDQLYVFVDRKSQKLSKNYLRNALIKIAKQAGLENITQVNILRNTFAAQLVINGIELATIKELMGATDQYIDFIYTTLTQQKAKDVVNVLNFGLSKNKREAAE